VVTHVAYESNGGAGKFRRRIKYIEGDQPAPSPVLKCKFCEWSTPEWTRSVDTYRGVAFKAGWPGLNAHVANVHQVQYRKIKKGLAQFDKDKAWALRH